MHHVPTMQPSTGVPNSFASREILVSGNGTLRKAGYSLADAELGKVNHHYLTAQHFLFGVASVIDNHGGTAAEMARDGRIDIAEYDTIEFHGRTFEIIASRDRYSLDLRELPQDTADMLRDARAVGAALAEVRAALIHLRVVAGAAAGGALDRGRKPAGKRYYKLVRIAQRAMDQLTADAEAEVAALGKAVM